MNNKLHDLICNNMEVYIDDKVVKSKNFQNHLVEVE